MRTRLHDHVVDLADLLVAAAHVLAANLADEHELARLLAGTGGRIRIAAGLARAEKLMDARGTVGDVQRAQLHAGVNRRLRPARAVDVDGHAVAAQPAGLDGHGPQVVAHSEQAARGNDGVGHFAGVHIDHEIVQVAQLLVAGAENLPAEQLAGTPAAWIFRCQADFRAVGVASRGGGVLLRGGTGVTVLAVLALHAVGGEGGGDADQCRDEGRTGEGGNSFRFHGDFHG